MDSPYLTKFRTAVWKVACPYCGAPVGKPCHTINGKPAFAPHTERVRKSRDG